MGASDGASDAIGWLRGASQGYLDLKRYLDALNKGSGLGPLTHKVTVGTAWVNTHYLHNHFLPNVCALFSPFFESFMVLVEHSYDWVFIFS